REWFSGSWRCRSHHKPATEKFTTLSKSSKRWFEQRRELLRRWLEKFTTLSKSSKRWFDTPGLCPACVTAQAIPCASITTRHHRRRGETTCRSGSSTLARWSARCRHSGV